MKVEAVLLHAAHHVLGMALVQRLRTLFEKGTRRHARSPEEGGGMDVDSSPPLL